MALPPVTGSPTRGAHRWRGGRIALEAAAITALIGGMWWPWWTAHNVTPDVQLPPPPRAPSINGFDLLTRALDTSKARAAASNEGRYYSEDSNVHTEVGKEVIARDYAPAIDAIHRALSLPWQYPLPRTVDALESPEGQHTGVPTAGIRNALRNCVLAGDVHVAHGDLVGAMQIWEDGMQFSADVLPRGGGFASCWTGASCEGIRQAIWAIIPSLNAAEARAAQRRVEWIDSHRIPLVEGLTNTKWSDESIMLDAMRTNRIGELIDEASSDSADGEGAHEPPWVRQIRAAIIPKTAALHDNAAYMDALIARAAEPINAPGVRFPRPPRDAIDTVFCANMYGTDIFAMQTIAAARTQDGLLEAALALRAYHADHGSYPDSPAALVRGGYLTRLPLDAFRPSPGPVTYRPLSADRYLLYSVGPDGRDDGGRPSRAQSSTWTPGAPPTGDVVAGVNVW